MYLLPEPITRASPPRTLPLRTTNYSDQVCRLIELQPHDTVSHRFT